MFGMKDELKIAPKGIDKEHKYASFFSFFFGLNTFPFVQGYCFFEVPNIQCCLYVWHSAQIILL